VSENADNGANPFATGKPVYGFSLDREKRDAFLLKCRDKYGIGGADFMRIVVDATLEDRISIKKPEGKVGVYEND